MNAKLAYETLQIAYNSPIDQIKKAYRKLALKCHPDRQKKTATSNVDFMQIKKAHDFLLDLKAYSNEKENKSPKQPPPNEFPLKLTLEEMFEGTIKIKQIRIKVVSENGDEQVKLKWLNVKVNRSCLPGSRITLSKEGDQFPGRPAANVVFILAEIEHSTFRRSRFDVHYTAEISSKEALKGCTISLPTLEGEILSLVMKEQITSSTIRRIANRGFYYPSPECKRGDLIVSFKIIFEASQKPPIEYDLSFTQEQISKGCQKKMQIERKIIDFNGVEQCVKEILCIDVPSGVRLGAKFVFPQKGDVVKGTIPADIVFIVKEKILQQDTVKHVGLNYETQHISNPEKSKQTFKRASVKSAQLNPVLHTLQFTKSQLKSGCIRMVDIFRKEFDSAGNEITVYEQEYLTILSGTRVGQQIVLYRKGDQPSPSEPPSNLTFIVRQLPEGLWYK